MVKQNNSRWGVSRCCLVASCILTIGCTAAVASEDGPDKVAQRSSALSGQVSPRKLCEFAVYGTQKADIRDRTTLVNGLVGSGYYVETGSNAQISGTVESSGAVLLRGSYIDGDVIAGGTVTKQQGTTVTGTIQQNAAVPVVIIPTKTFSDGTQAVSLYSGQSMNLGPGQYGEVHVYAGATLTLRSGTYDMNKLIMEASSATLRLDVGQGAIELNVADTLRFGNQLNMSLLNGNDPKLIHFYTNTQNQVVIGTDLNFYGDLTAPRAEVAVSSRTNINGSIHANSVIEDTDTHIVGLGCDTQPISVYPLGADTMTKSLSFWWPDYHLGVVSTASRLRFSFENVTGKSYTAVAKIRLFGPQGVEVDSRATCHGTRRQCIVYHLSS